MFPKAGRGHPTSPSLYWWCQTTHRAHSWKREKHEPAAPPARTGSVAQELPAPANPGTERHPCGRAETSFSSRVNSRYAGTSGTRAQGREEHPTSTSRAASAPGPTVPASASPGERAPQRERDAGRRQRAGNSGAGQALTMLSPPSAIPRCRLLLPLAHPPSVPGPSTGTRCPRRPFYGPPPRLRHAPAVQHGGSQRRPAPAHSPRRAPHEGSLQPREE